MQPQEKRELRQCPSKPDVSELSAHKVDILEIKTYNPFQKCVLFAYSESSFPENPK